MLVYHLSTRFRFCSSNTLGLLPIDGLADRCPLLTSDQPTSHACSSAQPHQCRAVDSGPDAYERAFVLGVGVFFRATGTGGVTGSAVIMLHNMLMAGLTSVHSLCNLRTANLQGMQPRFPR